MKQFVYYDQLMTIFADKAEWEKILFVVRVGVSS